MNGHSHQSWSSIAPRLAALMTKELEDGWLAAFARADDVLFNLSQADPSRGFIYMDTMSVVRHEKSSLLASWPTRVTDTVFKFGTAPSALSGIIQLSLVSDEELEESLAFTQMADTIAQAHGPLFETLSGVWAEVSDDAAIQASAPLTPQGLSTLVKSWLSQIKLSQQARVVVTKIFERELVKSLASLLPKSIALFQSAGWAVGSVAQPARPRPVEQPKKTLQSDQQAAEMLGEQAPARSESIITDEDWAAIGQANPLPNEAALAQAEQPGRTQAPTQTHMQPAASMSVQELAAALHDLLGTPSSNSSQQFGAQSQSAPAPANYIPSKEQDIDPLLVDLVSALQSRRQSRQAASAQGGIGSGEGTDVLSGATVQSVLNVFQNDLPTTIRLAARLNDRSLAQQFKQEMVKSAQQMGMSKKSATLDTRDEDAVDIVGMMFEVFLAERNLKEDVREDIVRLLSPYVKVALSDRKMFMHRSHPARRLLNAVAEACEGNTGETPQEKEALAKVSSGIDKISAQFNEDLAVFELIESELRSFIDQQRVRIELSEKRAAETQRGRDKLEHAKAISAKLFSEVLKGRNWPINTVDMIRTYWCHHHTVTSSRDNSDIPQKKSEALLRDMIKLGDDGTSKHPSLAAQRHHDILEMLASSGVLDQPAHDIVMDIFSALDDASRWANMSTAVESQSSTPTTQQVVNLAQAVAVASAPALELVVSKDNSHLDQEMVAFFRTMPVGSLVEFIKPDGTVQPGKMSWVSPISNRLLFVNPKGLKMAVETAEDLTQMVADGKLRLKGKKQEVLSAKDAFANSLHQVISSLSHPPASNIESLRAASRLR